MKVKQEIQVKRMSKTIVISLIFIAVILAIGDLFIEDFETGTVAIERVYEWLCGVFVP